MTITARALGGLLERHPEGWRWIDGRAEPRVYDVTPAEAFCFSTVAMVTPAGEHTAGVSIPRATLDAEPGLFEPLFQLAGDSVCELPSGVEIPQSVWDSWANATVIGLRWEPNDEAEIFARAEALKNAR